MGTNNELSKRIEQLIKVISAGVYEKETVFKLAVLALLSGESIFLLGLPGIAKSLISRRIKYAFHNGRNFEYLMNRFSTPEEIFGPISIKDLLKGHYVRIIDQYLPAVDIAFLDEIWKAGPSIQNTLLTIINEKIFRNGGVDIKVPLKLLISASNELPESGKGLEALFDRFIIRMIVHGLTNEKNFNDMLGSVTSLEVNVPMKLQIKTPEYVKWLKELETTVTLSKDTLNFISRFRVRLTEATDGKAYISDRRWKKIAKLIKASAYYNGRKTTDKPDLLVIPYCIWDDEAQEQSYTKLFNEAYTEELTYTLRKKQDELESELETLSNDSENIKDSKFQPSLYSEPFGGTIKGAYYRLLWHTDEFPICFISQKEYQNLTRRNKKSHTVTLFYGKSLSKLDGSRKIELQLKAPNELVDIKNRTSIQAELSDSDGKSQLSTLNSQMTEIKTQVTNLKQQFQHEHQRLSKTPSIFFDEQFKILLETAFFEQIPPVPESAIVNDDAIIIPQPNNIENE
ncbi:AAA family ATPase [Spiroplasma endosymbiont of Virgichneumon dumeticola]|uniref:AAA family ATPase n=1 Tax=Spiroplasma endosymbiont of Virgichneumon dumeticola TaxID=3139323 RepID=UPI0035C89AAC